VTYLSEAGIDLIITSPFDDEVRRTRAADFVDQLCHYLDMRQLWGGNFSLGYKREGDIPFLRRLGEEKGFTVELTDKMVMMGGELVSSSNIRRHLSKGDVARVRACLGRPYQVGGTVVMGDQRGRTIGFPTANLQEWQEQLLPANGVYATYAHVEGARLVSATNVGVRPTVNGGQVTVEAHLLDFDANIYGEKIQLEFLERIRSERKFSSLDALKAQIRADVEEVKRLVPGVAR
jgi:riboflavin kinase/FMN adenylyltransferase